MQPLDVRDFEESQPQREARVFYRLGLVSEKPSDHQREHAGKFYTFDQFISQAGINQYGSLKWKENQTYSFATGDCGFNFSKLREV